MDEDRAGKVESSLIDMTIEAWRFARLFERLLTKLDAGEQGRYLGQYRWFMKKVGEALEGADLRIVNIEGQRYDAGMAASPINADEFGSEDALVVDQMLEPIVMGPNGIVRTGTITLRKVEG